MTSGNIVRMGLGNGRWTEAQWFSVIEKVTWRLLPVLEGSREISDASQVAKKWFFTFPLKVF